ncbi:MAG: hypothetical protein RMI04_09125 [Thermofilaceae archaeon]|nr:hypothetical protein [Thermofilaceae archaeon]
MYEYIIPSVGNLLADALCSLGLFKLILMTEPLIKVECNLGHYEMLRIKSRRKPQVLESEVLKNLNSLLESEQVKQQLNFRVNTGKGSKPAFEVLKDLLRSMSSFSLSAFEPIAKKERKERRGFTTFYLSLLPVYGKGLEKYDGKMEGTSAIAKPEVIASYMIGLAYYTVRWEEGVSRLHLALIPPLGKRVDENYLLAITRVITLYSTEEGRRYINGLKALPRLALPLAVLAKLDLAVINVLHELHPPEALVFDVERVGGKAAETSRLYEQYNTAAILRFFLSLGEWMHDIKEHISSLVNVRGYREVENTELPGLIDSILLRLTLAIINRDADMLNGALFETLRLRDRLKEDCLKYVNRIYMLANEATSTSVRGLLLE